MNINDYEKAASVVELKKITLELVQQGHPGAKEALGVLEEHGIFAYHALFDVRKAQANVEFFTEQCCESSASVDSASTSMKKVHQSLHDANEKRKKEAEARLEHAKQEFEIAKAMWQAFKNKA